MYVVLKQLNRLSRLAGRATQGIVRQSDVSLTGGRQLDIDMPSDRLTEYKRTVDTICCDILP